MSFHTQKTKNNSRSSQVVFLSFLLVASSVSFFWHALSPRLQSLSSHFELLYLYLYFLLTCLFLLSLPLSLSLLIYQISISITLLIYLCTHCVRGNLFWVFYFLPLSVSTFQKVFKYFLSILFSHYLSIQRSDSIFSLYSTQRFYLSFYPSITYLLHIYLSITYTLFVIITYTFIFVSFLLSSSHFSKHFLSPQTHFLLLNVNR